MTLASDPNVETEILSSHGTMKIKITANQYVILRIVKLQAASKVTIHN